MSSPDRTPDAPADADDLAADLATAFADRYELGERIGEGGFGEVYRAFDRRLNRPVAVKASRADRVSPREADRLLDEARQLAQLRHPGIVTVHDAAAAGRRWFIVSELLTGPTLAGWMRAGRPGWAEAAEVAAHVADALAHAHARSIVHRDVKPSNVILIEGCRPVLVDFGIALSDQTPADRRDVPAGTPVYMSPEQIRGLAHPPDGRTDIYSLGITLYEVLCGEPPFRSESTMRLLRMIREDDPPPPRRSRPDLPLELERVILRALAKAPADRFTTAADFAAALRRVIEPAPATAPPAAEPEMRAAPRAGASIDVADPPTAEPVLTAAVVRPTEPERRPVTLLYAAFEPADADLDAAHENLLAFQAAFRATVTAFGGVPLPATGAGCLAGFGYPTAREDAPRLAVRAALALHAKTGARAAVHSGLAVVTESAGGTGVVGDVAAGVTRLDSPTASGVRISDATFRLVRGFFACEPAGMVQLRAGVPPVPAHAVTAERAARNRVEAAEAVGLTPLVGRDREVGLLRGQWELAAEGVGHVILLAGDPGLGKSRLVRVVREIAQATTGPNPPAPFPAREGGGSPSPRGGGVGEGSASDAVVEWYCSAHHRDSPLHPVTEFFTRAFGLDRESDPARRLERLIVRLKDDGITDPERVALFAAALSVPFGGVLPPLTLSPERQRERLREAVLDWLRGRAARRPVLFVVEDLHWIDPSTEELLGKFVDECGDAAILGVFTFRPEYEPPWKGHAQLTRIGLTRLTRRQVGELVRAQSSGVGVPEDAVDRIADRTDGVPLFVEEFTRALTEGGAVGTAIPATLQDLLLARLDRMASNKDVVQLGAAIDRTFDYELIRAACELPEPALRAELDKLAAAGVLLAKGTPPRCTYTFKHALIQDAAYQSMLRKRRQEVHRAVAAAIEQHFSPLAEAEPERLAHHYTEAGLTREAIDRWLRAGLRARDRSAHPEAIRHLARGLVLLAAEPPGPDRDARELAFRMPLAASSLATRGYASPEVETHLQAARELGERLGPSSPQFHVLMVTWSLRMIQGRIALAEEIARALIGLSEVADADGLRTEAHWAAGCTAWWAGDFPAARRHLQRADMLYRIDAAAEHARYTQQNCGPLLLAYDGLTLWALGLADQAEEKLATAVALAEDLKHPFTLAVTMWVAALAADLAGDGAAALGWAERVIELSATQSFAFWGALGVGIKGAALAQLGRDAEAVPLLRDSITRVEATGCQKGHQHALRALAGALWRLGERDAAWAALARAFAANDRDKERFLEAELYRLKAQFFLEQPDRNEYDATICLVRAIETARGQHARVFDLRASVDLARVWARTRPGEARELLGPAIEGFTEGLDSPDLTAARAVLKELGGR